MTEQQPPAAFLGKTARYQHHEYYAGHSFLRRSLKTILDQHQRELLEEQVDGTSREDMTGSEHQRAGWDCPTFQALHNAFTARQGPVLILDCLEIRRDSVDGSNTQQPQRRRQKDSGKPVRHAGHQMPCHVRITIHQTWGETERVHFDIKQAHLLQLNHDLEYPLYRVKLEKPFEVDLEKLFIAINSNSDAWQDQSSPTVASHYRLEISLQCDDTEDTIDLLQQLGSTVPITAHTIPLGGTLNANCDDFLGGSPSNRLLTLQHARGQRLNELKYVIKVLIGWNKRQSSALASHNRSLRNIAQQQPRQLLTPSGSDDLEKATHRLVVKYMYRCNFQVRAKTVDSGKCIFCPRDATIHTTLDRLYLHYITHHDQFRVDIDEGDDTADGHANVTKIWIDTSEKRTSSADTSHVIDWKAPTRPFDVATYVRGKDSWLSDDPKLKSAVPTKRGRAKKDAPPPEASPLPLTSRRDGRLAPWQIQLLPPRKRRYHCVQEVPGVTFYKTTSKQEVTHGSYISDSDDNVDDSGHKQTQRRELLDLGVDGMALKFNEALNRHLDEERPSSDTMISDALVRFRHKHGTEMQDREWKALFNKLIDRLRNGRIIDRDTATWCKSFETSDDGQGMLKFGSTEHSKRKPGPPNDAGLYRGDNEDDPTRVSLESIFCDEISFGRPEKGRHYHSIPIKDLVTDDLTDRGYSPGDLIATRHLNYTKFIRELDNRLGYLRKVDNIVCVSNGTNYVVTDEDEWQQALRAAHTDRILGRVQGPVQFQLVTQHELEQRLDTGSTGRFDEAASSTARLRDTSVTILSPDVAIPTTAPKRTRKSISTSEKEKATAGQSQRPIVQRCVCGESVEGIRGTIACASPRCSRDFHMTCVGLRRRESEWRCPDCSS